MRDGHLRYVQRLASKYGYDPILSDLVHTIFEEVVNPQALGFVHIKRGMYGRPASEDISHIMRLQAYKGASFGLRWGVSLTYVPHGLPGKVRWHRTLKSSNLDLFEEPGDYPPTRTNSQIHYYVPSLYGENCFRTELTTVWQHLQPIVKSWFDSTLTLTDVLDRSFEQMHRTWLGPSHYPDPAIIHLLTLSRLGRTDAALVMLADLSSRKDAEYLGLDPLSSVIMTNSLAPITPEQVHAEVNTGRPVGNELW